jgi:hypothetical protein
VRRCEAAHGLRGGAQAERKHCRDVPNKDFRGEWFSSRELCHDVGKREEDALQALLGRSRTQEGVELAP